MGQKVSIEPGADQDSLIEIIEEKLGPGLFIKALEKRGVNVKICGNCDYFLPKIDHRNYDYLSEKQENSSRGYCRAETELGRNHEVDFIAYCDCEPWRGGIWKLREADKK